MGDDGWWVLTGLLTSGTVVLLGFRRLRDLLRSEHDPWAERAARQARERSADDPPGGPQA